MEKAGTGIQRVTDACIKNNNKINFEFSDSFWVTMHSNVTDEVGEKVGEKVGDNLTANQKKIIDAIKNNNSVSAKKLASKVGISQRKVEENLAKLKLMGILKRIGPAKGGHWQVIQQ